MDTSRKEGFRPIALQRMRDMECKAHSHFHNFTIHNSHFHDFPRLICYVPTHHFLHRLAWIHACGRKNGAT